MTWLLPVKQRPQTISATTVGVGTGADYWSSQLLGRSLQKARNFTASSHQNAGFSIWVFKNFPDVIPPDPHSGRGDPLPHPAPAFGWTHGACALMLGPKPWSPSTFQPWLHPATDHLSPSSSVLCCHLQLYPKPTVHISFSTSLFHERLGRPLPLLSCSV